MPSRTVKGPEFTIIVNEKRIIVKHVYSKGKRCRIIAPEGVSIEVSHKRSGVRGECCPEQGSNRTPEDID